MELGNHIQDLRWVKLIRGIPTVSFLQDMYLLASYKQASIVEKAMALLRITTCTRA